MKEIRILAKDIIGAATEKPNEELKAAGWVHRIRELGGITFVLLRDRSGIVQLVLEDKPDLTLESVIEAWGLPALNEKAPGGAELRVTRFECLSRAAADLPYQVNGDIARIGLETILDYRSLSLRNPKIRSIFKVQATIIAAFADYMRKEDFTEIKSSKLVGSGAEGGTELFEVDYFDKKVYLAQSPQLYKQTMVAAGMERVFEVAPAYRAEKHDTPRHLNEYISLDVEMGFIDSELDLINFEKGLLAYIFDEVAARNQAELDQWGAAVPDAGLVSNAPLISYGEALLIAADELNGKSKIFDLNPEVERLVCTWALREKGIDLVFVNQFPRRYRPFYTYPVEADGVSSTMSFDTLFRGLEITTGGRRQHDYQALLETLPKFNLMAEDLEDYLAVFKYGCPPHGGFALGAERLTQKILGLGNVKEASLFPRDRRRVKP